MFKEDVTQYCKNCYELQEQLDQLKAENEELKKEIETKTYHWEQCTEEMLKGTQHFVDRMEKAEKTLTEIKEIAEDADRKLFAIISDDYTEGYCWLGRLILQKISECEGNDE